MDRFDAVLCGLTSDEKWNNQNWEYSGVKEIKSDVSNFSVKEQLAFLRRGGGVRYVEWKCRIPGQEWKRLRLVENLDKSVLIDRNW